MRLRPCLIGFVTLATILTSGRAASAKSWMGITPLHSTRVDVERILGKPVFDQNVYDAPDGRAIVSYSSGAACEEGVPGLGNVPRDTVTEIRLSLAKPIKLSDLLIANRQYVQIQAVHTPHVYYVDQIEGVRYTAEHGFVESIEYSGSVLDEKRFSCGEPKYAAPVPANPKAIRIEQYPLDSYGKIRFEDARARLDNFVIQLFQENEKKRNYRGFILVYAGKSAHVREARMLASCSKNYLVNVRHADRETIVAVDAGYREEFEVELYIYPIDAYPPMLLPTVSPSKVNILKGAFSPCK